MDPSPALNRGIAGKPPIPESIYGDMPPSLRILGLPVQPNHGHGEAPQKSCLLAESDEHSAPVSVCASPQAAQL
jgi:hypothetical protein